jgi:hypothetical protein
MRIVSTDLSRAGGAGSLSSSRGGSPGSKRFSSTSRMGDSENSPPVDSRKIAAAMMRGRCLIGVLD